MKRTPVGNRQRYRRRSETLQQRDTKRNIKNIMRTEIAHNEFANENKTSFDVTKFKQKLENYQHLSEEITVPRKTVLLREGETSQQIFFVKQGALRLWANNNGEDITFRFCFENEAASSFLGNEPSIFTIETLEPSKRFIKMIK